mmetsp:Transcript_5439/g.15375  ORF Transcript_5439/g.15375 Transcript_5439/m.15375 type:complete len:87 (-) Transcript_5439:776-1036(-)
MKQQSLVNALCKSATAMVVISILQNLKSITRLETNCILMKIILVRTTATSSKTIKNAAKTERTANGPAVFTVAIVPINVFCADRMI